MATEHGNTRIMQRPLHWSSNRQTTLARIWLRTARSTLLLFAGALAACQAAQPGPQQQIPPTLEEARVAAASQMMPNLIANAQSSARQLLNQMPKPSSATNATTIQRVSSSGQRLWQLAVKEAQRPAPTLDDRPLYWTRLATKLAYKADCDHPQCAAALDAFEERSRGMQDLTFARDADLQILVTGFDPFSLDRNIQQSNPSGVLALQLDNVVLRQSAPQQSASTFTNKPITAEVQAVIFPVRFRDFDDATVEELISPLLAAGQVDAIITLSMGRTDFDLERFPGRRRATTAPDNLNQTTGASATNPLVPKLAGQPLPGPEFVEFSLPAAALGKIKAPFKVNDNRQVTTLEGGAFHASSLQQLAGHTAVAGSGGTYLSNEISFRSVRLVQAMGANVAVGHIHLPRIQGHDQARLEQIRSQLIAMLRNSLSALKPVGS